MGIKLKKFLKIGISYLAMTIAILFIIEGFSSFLVIFRTLPLPDYYHTKYDPILGWVNIPNLFIDDLYGVGKYFKTNSQGFRNDKDFNTKIPEHKVRIICSGDSLTMGHGVSNDEAWCQVLTALDNHIETVNMAMSGYGVDQAYLSYMRDGIKIDHHIHLFAFIEDDFDRAQATRFIGYDKPILRLENNTLITDNVPVPTQTYYFPRLKFYMGNLANELRSVNLLKKIRNKLINGKATINRDTQNENNTKDIPIKENTKFQKLVLRIFEDLEKTSKEKGSILIAVYLPSHIDYSEVTFWRPFLSKELEKRGILFIDLTDDFKKYPDSIHKLFIAHYSPLGNRFVAEKIYGKLLLFPETAKLFQ